MGGRSSSSTAQASTNTDRSIVNDEGLVFGGDTGQFNANDNRDQSVVAIDTSDRSLTDASNRSINAWDGSNRSITSLDSRDQSISAVDSSNRSFNDDSTTTTNTYTTTNMLDAGAINAAFASNNKNVDATLNAFAGVINFARDITKTSAAENSSFRTEVADAYRAAAIDTKGAFDQKTMIILAALGAGAFVLPKR